jgi:ribonuclease HI
VDVAFSTEEQAGAYGAIITKVKGAFVAASSSFILHVASPAMAKAPAMLHGLLFAHSLGYTKTEVASDSSEVVNI